LEQVSSFSLSPRLQQVISCVGSASAEGVEITPKCPFPESPLEERTSQLWSTAKTSYFCKHFLCTVSWDTHVGKIGTISLIRHFGWVRENQGAT